ncbi:hypothetical protein BDN67DRAFT_966894 [Paxillus ammoniavirescens]|nr:hypothetical protein BDN67DRAFT_966894 [Paxillus ammoniavirescens]
MKRIILCGLVSAQVLTAALAQTWCGKHYMSSQSIVVPGGNFPPPVSSKDPLLAFRCAPAIRPYLAEDASSPAAVLIDSPVVYYEIANAKTIYLAAGSVFSTELDVTISLNGETLARELVPLNATAYELPFSLEGITPQMAAYNLSCEATYSGSMSATSLGPPQTFSATTTLSVLPNPTNSSVTKMDLRTGALLAKPATGIEGAYKPVFPIGFYTNFGGYLATNLSIIDELKEQGQIHPVPTFDNLTALNMVIDKMQEVGMYLIYDMRSTYMNSTSVTEQVNSLKNRPNLLLWYTADEPDGTSDPLNATTIAYDLIYDLDGYHPVSLVLNCQDYYWSSYTAGTDIAFGGGGDYWSRAPTGEEWVVQSIMSINEGALGVTPWADPTPADIKASASAFAKSLPKITPFLFNPAAVRTTYVVGGASVATWKAGTLTLVLATNTNYASQTVTWEALGLLGSGATTVFVSGTAETSHDDFTLGSVGSSAFVVNA